MSPKLAKLTITAFLLGSTTAAALPFASYDPQSMAMGGVGVAVADAALAPMYNPALLAVTPYNKKFSLVLPAIGIRVADPDNLIGSVDQFLSDKSIDGLQTAISTLNTDIGTPASLAVIQADAAAVSSKLNTVSDKLSSLSDKPLLLSGGLSTVVGIPNKVFGAAFYGNVTVATSAMLKYKDASTISALSSKASCIATAADGAAVNACGTLSFDSTSTMQSELNIRGIRFVEMGFALSREFRINYERMSLGITPKMVQAQLYEVPISVNSTSTGNLNYSDYYSEYNMANFDVGVAKNFRTGWRAGLVVKNIVPYVLYFRKAPTPGTKPVETGSSLRLIPQTRAGVSYTNNWSVIALDMDLYRNDPVGLENHTQYIALGGELNSRGWIKLRGGYRADLVNSARNIISLGLGFTPFDIAIAGNLSEISASMQLAFGF